jgi:hypothetical protein
MKSLIIIISLTACFAGWSAQAQTVEEIIENYIENTGGYDNDDK